MQTGRAIIIAAAIVAGVGSATAFLVQPRYSLTNVGGGNSIRLNKSNGDMVGCNGLNCEALASGGKLVDPWAKYAVVNEAAPSANDPVVANAVGPKP